MTELRYSRARPWLVALAISLGLWALAAYVAYVIYMHIF